MDRLIDLLTNPFFMTSISSWLIAQVLKAIINAIVNKKLDLERLFGDGGMPSGHSATVSSLATITGLIRGFGSFEFAIAVIFAIIVCHDAMGVRQETGKQAVLLNELVDTLEKLFKEDLPDAELKEFVGHTPLQVIAGITLGVINAIVIYSFFL